jgi:hypothetical protein
MVAIPRTPARFVREHLEALHTGSRVTGWFRRGREPEVLHVSPENVLAALKKAGINCVLMGVHGINVYRDQARATDDVDVLVTKKDVRKAIRVLDETFPYLEIRENSAVARFVNLATLKVVIDVMKPSSRLMQQVFRHSVAIGKSHRIPSLPMALILKYRSMTSPNRRRDKKLLDEGDFTNMVLTNRATLDLAELKRLADLVEYHLGSKILALIAQVDADPARAAGDDDHEPKL